MNHFLACSVLLFSIFVLGCSDIHTVKSEYGTGQSGDFSFTVPTTASEPKIEITFDKDIKDITVRHGKNVKCEGKVCTFIYRSRQPLRKGQKLKLEYRLGLVSPGEAQLNAFEFNGENICGIGAATTTTASSDLDEYESEYEYEDPQCADIDGYK